MGLIGSDFITRKAVKSTRCGECGKSIPIGADEMVSIKRDKVAKRVCSEECRLEFDNNFWQGVAREK